MVIPFFVCANYWCLLGVVMYNINERVGVV